jgi:Neuraminidase (sialidase)
MTAPRRPLRSPLAFAFLLAVGFLLAPPRLAAQSPSPFLEVLPEPVLRGMIHLPGLLVTRSDTVVVIAQSRLQKGDWDPSDIIVTRSLDQGKTWSAPVKLFASDGKSNLGYSCVLVEDRTTSPPTLMAHYTIGPVPWKSHELVWHARRSTDDGATWSEPFLVKNDGQPESKPSNGGHGFQFPNGRLVIPGRKSFLTSDDGGTSWTTHPGIDSVETKVTPVVSGQGPQWDSVYTIGRKTLDYQTFDTLGDRLHRKGQHGNLFTTHGRNPGLGSVPRPEAGTPPLLLMTGIIEKEGRPMAISHSLDQGQTWSKHKLIDGKGWYSDLGVTQDGTIVVAYTVNFSGDLKIARFNLPWVLSE